MLNALINGQYGNVSGVGEPARAEELLQADEVRESAGQSRLRCGQRNPDPASGGYPSISFCIDAIAVLLRPLRVFLEFSRSLRSSLPSIEKRKHCVSNKLNRIEVPIGK